MKVTDLGIVKSVYGDREQVAIDWQTGANGNATVKQWLRNSVHPDSNMTKVLVALLGEKANLADLDLETLVGKEAELDLAPNAKGFARVKAVYPLNHKPKGNVHGVDISDDDLPAALQ